MKSTVIVLISGFLGLLGSPAGAQAPDMALRPANVPQQTDLLPSLKSHMARLEALMNLLFRQIGEPEKAPELIAATREMEQLLFRAGAFRPDAALFEPDAEKEAKTMRGFHACLDRARSVLAGLREVLSAGTGGDPKRQLLKLDQVRRECHAAFG